MFAIELAGVPIAVSARYPLMNRLCRDFTVNIPIGNCAFSIKATDGDIASMRKLLTKTEPSMKENAIIPSFKPDYCECMALYLQACNRLLKFDTLFLHAAVIEHKGYAYAFIAPSGTGKSTHAKLWLDNNNNGNTSIINGDKPLLHLEHDCFVAYGSPLTGKENWGNNTNAPLKAICFIERSMTDRLERLKDESIILKKISTQLHYYTKAQSAAKQLLLLDKLIQTVDFYTLKCTQNISAYYEALKMTEPSCS